MDGLFCRLLPLISTREKIVMSILYRIISFQSCHRERRFTRRVFQCTQRERENRKKNEEERKSESDTDREEEGKTS